MRTQVTVKFYVDVQNEEYAEGIVRSELDENRQMFKKWYNQYDNSSGIVSYEIVNEEE